MGKLGAEELSELVRRAACGHDNATGAPVWTGVWPVSQDDMV